MAKIDLFFGNRLYTRDYFCMIPVTKYHNDSDEDDEVLDMTGNLDAGVD